MLGRNDVGQTDVPEGFFRQISVGVMNTCGLLIDGDMICWGNNDNDDS